MTPAIKAEGLSKQYRLGRRAASGSFREAFARTARAPLDWTRRLIGRGAPRQTEWIWALDDVTFSVPEGDIVGVIGRNGSGKSTLLKILSRITEPTRGRAEVRGRVGSLLEVGTGFHFELTGRENVYINGAILGMRRAEIAARFDEIVAFADVDRFIDTPVKFYSSGMQMRLAFAVAAHLEPDILLVDEVLAVGDLAFQKKCLGKMDDVSRSGRTILFVSHQMNQIRRLCKSAIWLDGGRVRYAGSTGDVIGRYEQAVVGMDHELAQGQCFLGWELSTGGHKVTHARGSVTFHVHVRLNEPVRDGHFGLALLGDNDDLLAGWAFEPLSLPPGKHVLSVTVESLPLRPGSYRLNLGLFDAGNNLNGGRLLEKWLAAPALQLDVPPLAHPQEQWAGVLNVPATLATHVDRKTLVAAG